MSIAYSLPVDRFELRPEPNRVHNSLMMMMFCGEWMAGNPPQENTPPARTAAQHLVTKPHSVFSLSFPPPPRSPHLFSFPFSHVSWRMSAVKGCLTALPI